MRKRVRKVLNESCMVMFVERPFPRTGLLKIRRLHNLENANSDRILIAGSPTSTTDLNEKPESPLLSKETTYVLKKEDHKYAKTMRN